MPLSASELHRGQPPSLQFFTLRGVPLYPVEMMRLSLTITAATLRFMQFDRRGHDAGDLHEILVPAGTLGCHQPLRGCRVDLGFEGVDAGVVDDCLLSQFVAGAKLLVGGVAAVELALLLLDELFARFRQAVAAALAHALVTHVERCIEVQ